MTVTHSCQLSHHVMTVDRGVILGENFGTPMPGRRCTIPQLFVSNCHLNFGGVGEEMNDLIDSLKIKFYFASQYREDLN